MYIKEIFESVPVFHDSLRFIFVFHLRERKTTSRSLAMFLCPEKGAQASVGKKLVFLCPEKGA